MYCQKNNASCTAIASFLTDGGHFMVYNRAEWVGRQVAAILQNLPSSLQKLR
jgi:hypothetical protein